MRFPRLPKSIWPYTMRHDSTPTVVARLRGLRPSPKAPRALRASNGHPAFFTASNTHLSHAHPVQGRKDGHMRFHSVPKRIWVMANAPRQQTYSSPRLQRALKTATCVFPDSQNAFKPIPSAPRQQTCNPRLHRPQTATQPLKTRLGHADSRPSVAKVPTQDSHMRFTDSQNAFKPIPSAPRQQTCNLRFHGPQNGHIRFHSLPKRI